MEWSGGISLLIAPYFRRTNDVNKMFHSVFKIMQNKKALPIGKTSNGLIILNL